MAFWKKTSREKELPRPAEDASLPAPLVVARQEAEEKTHTEASGKSRGYEGILRSPHATEKASAGQERGVYVFRVDPRAGKDMIARAVEARYGVSVDAVRVAHMPAKERRRGRVIGWKPGFKKAMVTIKKGEKIEIQ